MSNDLDADIDDISTAGQRRYKLVDLIAQCDLEAPVSDELKAWEQMPPVGGEQT